MRHAFLLDDIRTPVGIYSAGTRVQVDKAEGTSVTVRCSRRNIRVHAIVLGDKPLTTNCSLCGRAMMRRKTRRPACLVCLVRPADVPDPFVPPPPISVDDTGEEYEWMRAAGLSENQIARRLGLSVAAMRKRLERAS